MEDRNFSGTAALIRGADRSRSEALRRGLEAFGKRLVRRLRLGEAIARYRRRAKARATYLMLRELDDRMLLDIGLHPSELRSILVESALAPEVTRLRALPVGPMFRVRPGGVAAIAWLAAIMTGVAALTTAAMPCSRLGPAAGSFERVRIIDATATPIPQVMAL